MKKFMHLFLIIIFTLSTLKLYGQIAYKTFLIKPAKLTELNVLYQKKEIQNNPAFKRLINEADEYLTMKPVSVMDKSQTPPSGNKHDYMSMGPYWWPNPETKNGLPYIRRDGERNPEIYKITDHTLEAKMAEAVKTLSLTYAITRNPKYSAKAAELLRVWFLNENTKMNPNLNYAQGIPGICTGRGIGIIETHSFSDIVDAVGILETSGEWTKKDDAGIKKWFGKYLNWLTTGKYGKDEAEKKNNHGTWCNVQVVSISLFLGKDELAKKILNEAKVKRIGHQIEADGKQPEELVRTKAWSYSLFNLGALFQLAYLGDNVGIDLWHYKNSRGGSIRKALDFILPYSTDLSKWKYQQIAKIDVNSVYPLLLIAEKKYSKEVYSDWIKKIFNGKEGRLTANLFY